MGDMRQVNDVNKRKKGQLCKPVHKYENNIKMCVFRDSTATQNTTIQCNRSIKILLKEY
jgi:hypothetical protein